MRVSECMTRDVQVVEPDQPIREAAQFMLKADAGSMPVCDGERLVGMITDRDIVVRAVAEGKDCNNTRAEDIMSVDIHTTRPNDRVVEVIRMMANKQVRRIPVVNDNRYLVGMISMADVAQEVDDDRELGEALEEISKTTSFWNRVFG